MKRFVSQVLLLVFLYFFVGYYPIFRSRLAIIKREMKMKMIGEAHSKELTHFHFTREAYDGLNWKESHEFFLGDSLYDVVKEVRDEAGNIDVYCLNDKQEQALYAQAREQAERNQTDRNQWQKIISGACIPSPESWFSPMLVTNVFFREVSNIFPADTDIPTPPPRRV